MRWRMQSEPLFRRLDSSPYGLLFSNFFTPLNRVAEAFFGGYEGRFGRTDRNAQVAIVSNLDTAIAILTLFRKFLNDNVDKK